MCPNHSLETTFLNDMNKIQKKMVEDMIKLNDIANDLVKEFSQNLMLGLIIIRFAEDYRLIEKESLRKTLDSMKKENALSLDVINDILKKIEPEHGYILFNNEFSEKMCVSSDVIKEIGTILYRYDFNNFSVSLLGSIYELFLSHNLNQNNELETEHAKKFKDGVYYTPPSIVNYIVETALKYNSVSLSELKILDPASGAGIFLIEIMNRIFSSPESAKINVVNKFVKNSIYGGVDIDKRAIYIAKISITLLCLQMNKKIPSNNNLKNFNSVTKSVEGWRTEFNLINNEGFDIIIGNPPWGADFTEYEDKIANTGYTLAKKPFDIYEIFIELGCRLLSADSGVLCFVIPDSIFRPEFEKTRKFLTENYRILEILKLGEGFFKNVYHSATIICIKNQKPASHHKIKVLNFTNHQKERILKDNVSIRQIFSENCLEIYQSRFNNKNNRYEWNITASDFDMTILEKMMKDSLVWRNYLKTNRGIEFAQNGLIIQCPYCLKWNVPPKKHKGKYRIKKCENCENVYEIRNAASKTKIVSDTYTEGMKKFLLGENVNRYRIAGEKYIDISKSGFNYKSRSLYKGKKMLVRKTGIGIYATITTDLIYFSQSVFVYKEKNRLLPLKLEYFLGIINSRLILYYYYLTVGDTNWKSFPQLTQSTIEKIPVKQVTEQNKHIYDNICRLVTDIIANGYSKEKDMEIENLVFELYEITDDEKERVFDFLKNSVQILQIIKETMNYNEEKKND